MNNLKAIMEERSLTCKRLSEISGVAPNTIKKFRRDDEAITRAYKATVQQLADALHVTPAVLAGTERYEKGNSYLEADVRKDNGATIFNKECAYREESLHRYINVIDNGCKMLRCPECKCQIQAYPFSYAVGTRGYSFCPYCGKDMRKHETEKTTS